MALNLSSEDLREIERIAGKSERRVLQRLDRYEKEHNKRIERLEIEMHGKGGDNGIKSHVSKNTEMRNRIKRIEATVVTALLGALGWIASHFSWWKG